VTEQRLIYTIGHSTRSIEEFVYLLKQVDVTLLVDVRSIPRSRAVPWFNGDALPGTLLEHGIAYSHLESLGGRRHTRKDAPPSVNTYWKVEAFRSYADYAATAEFRAGLATLGELAAKEICAIMCAEAVWWRCHRRIIADYLLAAGMPVEHIMGEGKVVPATMTPGARVMPNGVIEYPAEEPPSP
jgi:uncharacterized protein (DUF488 family)